MRFPLFFALLLACEEEAVMHPPAPPTMPTGELVGKPASRPVAVAAVEGATGGPSIAEKADLIPKSHMTLETLMEDYVEPIAKKAFKAKTRSPELDDLLAQIAKMTPDDPKFAVTSPQKNWAGIVDNAVKPTPPKYGQSCKQCHTLWRKPYKAKFHKREIEVVLPATE